MTEKSDLPQSAYAVAWEMTRTIAAAEGKPVGQAVSHGGADRAFILALYRNCLEAIASQSLRVS